MERKAAKKITPKSDHTGSVANPFKISYRDNYRSVMCVYKVWVGDKYFIGAAKALRQHMNHMAVEIDRRLRLGIEPGHHYYELVSEIQKTNVQVIDVEVVIATVSGYDLLKTCYDVLQGAKDDSRRLNTNLDPYIAGWLPKSDQDRFKRYVSSINNK